MILRNYPSRKVRTHWWDQLWTYKAKPLLPQQIPIFFFSTFSFHKSRTMGLRVEHKPKTKFGSQINKSNKRKCRSDMEKSVQCEMKRWKLGTGNCFLTINSCMDKFSFYDDFQFFFWRKQASSYKIEIIHSQVPLLSTFLKLI